MSEFTVGLLFRRRWLANVEAVITTVFDEYVIEHLNSQWSSLYISDSYLRFASTIQSLCTLSQTVPLLHFDYAADHGWGYQIFWDGSKQASFYHSYSLEYEQKLFMPLAKKYFGTDDEAEIEHLLFGSHTRELHESFFARVRHTPEYRHAFEQQFLHTGVAQFALFDFAPATLNRIESILSYEHWHPNDWITPDVEQFKDVIGIKEMNWKSFRYATRRPGRKAHTA